MKKGFKYWLLVLAFNKKTIGIYLGSLLLITGLLSSALEISPTFSAINMVIGIIILAELWAFLYRNLKRYVPTLYWCWDILGYCINLAVGYT